MKLFECGAEFSEPSASETSLVDDESPGATPSRDVHACNICGKTYKYRSLLEEHHRRHTGEMPFECSHPGCSFRYKWRSSLSNHRRYHQRKGDAPVAVHAKRSRRARPAPAVKAAVIDVADAVVEVPCAPIGVAETFEGLDSAVLDSLWSDVLQTGAIWDNFEPLVEPSFGLSDVLLPM